MDQPILVDTNIYIRLLRQKRDPAAALFEHFDTVNLITCGMVQLEVLRGIRHDRTRERLSDFFATMQYVTTDHALWREAADLAFRADRAGFVIPNTDAFIAACAFRRGAAVLTADIDFQRIEGLAVLAPPPTLF
jgi:predicted nucleic acid-binding protein